MFLQEGKSEYLEGLLEATKELSHIDRSNIFFHLLKTYCKSGETDKALGLWTLLQEEGTVPSEQFLVDLGEHLKSQKREVPFVMPQDNSRISKPKAIHGMIEKKDKPIPKLKHTKDEVSSTIESLIHEGKLPEATNIALKSVQEGTIPKQTVFKFLLKNLALEGLVENIQQFDGYLNESMRKKVTYDDKLTLAIFKRGAGSQHIDELLGKVQAATTSDDMSVALRKFPRSNALADLIANADDEVVAKCK